jgi:NAD(P)-dependent dehydrogenase (short-subunit alcohol dehydrogenase family)
MIDLQGQHVLVLGGSSGIGFATARMAIRNGARVTIASRSVIKVERAVAALGAGATGRVVDLTDDQSVDRFFDSSDNWNHVVVTASEVNIKAVRELSMADAHQAMNSKFWGAYRTARRATINPGGSLGLVAGYLATRPAPNRALMSAINAALEGLTRGLALELRPVRINAVSPAFVDTPLWDAIPPANRSTLIATNASLYPAGRVGAPDDIAQLLVLFMTNPYATGTVVTLDGGASLA